MNTPLGADYRSPTFWQRLFFILAITVVGTFLYSVGINAFYVPHHFLAGGLTGIAMILNYLTGFPIGIANLILNIPILLLALKFMGKFYTLITIIGTVLCSVFIDLTAPSPVVALHETWEVTAYAPIAGPRPAHVFDLVITQTCATDDPLILPEYHYGGLGFRGHGQWDGAGQARFLTSEGLTDRVQAHATRARWCHVGGQVDGQWAGVAILGHPDNFRAPQPMRIHPTEPFFCFAPSQLGAWQITPGEPYVARYRFVVMDGEPDPALLEAYWAGYAQPVVAEVRTR